MNKSKRPFTKSKRSFRRRLPPIGAFGTTLISHDPGTSITLA